MKKDNFIILLLKDISHNYPARKESVSIGERITRTDSRGTPPLTDSGGAPVLTNN